MRIVSARAHICLMSVAVIAGCSQNSGADLSKAKEDAEAARAEVVSLRSDLAKAKAEMEAIKSGSDLKQARFVAEGFLTAITKPSVDQLHGFCTPAEQKRAGNITIPSGKLPWSIESEAIGSSMREATFKGHFEIPAGKQSFVVLVIKFAEAGHDRWLVDAFSVGG